MDKALRVGLKKLWLEFGEESCKDNSRFKGLIMDFCPQAGDLKTNLLIMSVQHGLVRELKDTPYGSVDETSCMRILSHFINTTGVKDEYAKWVLEVWANALGKKIPDLTNNPCLIDWDLKRGKSTQYHILSFDIGGDGIKTMLSTYTNFSERPISEKVNYFQNVDLLDFKNWIKCNIQNEAVIIGISSPGIVDYNANKIIRWAGIWENYDIIKDFEDVIANCKKICLLNDGEAHAYASIDSPKPVMVVSLGTAVGFGMITADNEFVRNNNNTNIEIGDFTLETTCTRKEIWNCCGQYGLQENMRLYGEFEGVGRFGYRIGTLLILLYKIYQPKTIVLTGGVIQKYGKIIYLNALEKIKWSGLDLDVTINERAKDSALIGIRNYSLIQFRDHCSDLHCAKSLI